MPFLAIESDEAFTSLEIEADTNSVSRTELPFRSEIGRWLESCSIVDEKVSIIPMITERYVAPTWHFGSIESLVAESNPNNSIYKLAPPYKRIPEKRL
jgi:hypothetical protein